MSWIDGVRATVRGWLMGRREDRELREEMAYHLERATEENVRTGMSASAGGREAHMRFGPVDRVHEEVRDARGARLLDDLGRDAAYALRSLVRAPAFTVAALLTIALGVGATTAIFSVVRGVVLRPLPFGNEARLVSVWGRFLPESGFDFPTFPLSGPEYLDYRDAARTLADVAAYTRAGVTLVQADGPPQRLQATIATANLYAILGVRPAQGRLYTAAEDEPGGPPIVVLGHGLWRSTFAADPAIVGRTIRLDGVETEVIGVLPEGISFPDDDYALYGPLRLDPANPGNRAGHYLSAVGVRAPDATLEDVHREMDVLMARWKADYPEMHTGHFLYAQPFVDDVIGGVRPVLLVLLGAVAFVLLIACANVANLLLARGEARSHEMVVRGALGAGRARLARQLLTESVVLGVAGGVAGTVVAWLALRPLLALGAGTIPRADAVSVDVRVLVFALVVTLACSLLFGVVPALRAGRTAPVESLRGAGRTTAGRYRTRLRAALVAVQVALAFLLVTGAGLMLRSFRALTGVDAGFDPAGVLVATISLPRTEYADTARVLVFTDVLLARLRALPGVDAASATSSLPLLDSPGNWDFDLEGVPAPLAGQPAHSGDHLAVAPGYAEALGIPMVAGRFFEPADREDALPVAVVSETLARMFFPGTSPIGRRMRVAPDGPWLTIVGEIGDVRYASLGAPPRPSWYIPVAQAPVSYGPERTLTYVLRTAGEPAAQAEPVRAAVRDLDRNLPIPTLSSMEEVIGNSVARPRFLTTLLTLFGTLAAVLGAIGLYGVLAYTVAQRRTEFAVRMAVGAGAGRIFASVVRDGFLLAALGIALGASLSLGAVRVLRTLLYGVAPRDPATFLTVAGLLLLVALVACTLPAVRAIRVPPLDALRSDG